VPSLGIAAAGVWGVALWFALRIESNAWGKQFGGWLRSSIRKAVERPVSGLRRRKLEVGIPAALRSLADAVDSGEVLVSAAVRVGSPGSEVGRHLASFARDCMRGSSVPNALNRLTGRHNGDLWIPMAFAVEMHLRCGGDLSLSLRSVASASESGHRSRAEARAATAQARFTGNLVCALPLLGLLGGALLMPHMVGQMTGSPLSLGLLVVAAVIQGLSLLAIRRLAGVAAR